MSEEVLLASGREQAGLYSGADGAMQEKDVSQVMTPPELADRYRFIKALGEGAQGKVFLAQRLLDGKQVAIKQLRIDSIKTWKEYTLFHREAEVLENLDIPGVVKFYEACDCLDATPPCSYIVQEYIDGMSLKTVLNSGYRFSLSRAYDIFLQLLDILEKLHKHDPPVIHRDIKPSNIMLRDMDKDEFQVCLIDFGAVANPQIQSGGSTIAGTFGYMSPEQNIGRAAPQSDIYALAALFAYIISGVDPADMKTQDLRLIIDPYVENQPVALVQTLRRMLEPGIEHRLADYDELRRRFNEFKAGRYDLQDDGISQFSDEELVQRLKDVKSLCQPQNMEIWQALPDQPQKRGKFPIDLWTNPRFAGYPLKRPLERKESSVFDPAFRIGNMDVPYINMILFAGVLPIVWIGFWIFNLVNSSTGDFNGIGTLKVIGFVILLALVFQIISMRKRKTFKDANIRGRLPWIDAENYISPSQCDVHCDIYEHGRKTIATITAIEYISATKFAGSHAEEAALFKCRIEQAPTFRIFYKFNPPDDDFEEDIIHSVDTHRDPEGLFKVGDVLPILYMYKGFGDLYKEKPEIYKDLPDIPGYINRLEPNPHKDMAYLNGKKLYQLKATHRAPDGKVYMGYEKSSVYWYDNDAEPPKCVTQSMPYPFPLMDLEDKHDYICYDVSKLYI